MHNNVAPSRLFNEREVAERLAVSVATIRRWRLFRQGPMYIKVGGAAVRYRREDVESWLCSRPTGGDATKVGAHG